MATIDLIERLGFSKQEDPEDDMPDVPDDASELTDDQDQEDVLPPDPKPARKKARQVRLPESSTRASASEKRQVKDALTLMVSVPAGIWAMRDPHCGAALQGQADAIIKAAVPIVCRNPAMLRWFTATNAPWLDIVALMTALAPFVATVWGHHVSHTIGGEDQGPDVDLTAYAAPSFG